MENYSKASYSEFTTTGSSTKFQVLAANTARRYAAFINDSDTAMYIRFGSSSTGSVKSGIRVNAGGMYEMLSGRGNVYKGVVYAACASSGKTLLVVEGV